MRRKSSLLFSFRKVKKGVNNLQNINWLSEIAKVIIISILTTVVLFIIRRLSPGNYDGERLALYLDKCIENAAEIETIESRVLYNGTYDVLSDNKAIFVYSRESSQISDRGGELKVCISVFERRESGILDDFFGILPSYKLKSCHVCNAGYGVLEYEGFEWYDLDNDGKLEYSLKTTSRFASRISHEWILLDRVNGEWKIISPDALKLTTETGEFIERNAVISGCDPYGLEHTSTEDNVYLKIEVFRFEDVLKQDAWIDIMGVGNEGTIYFLSNPINSAFEICYQIKCEYDEIGKEAYLYCMQQYSNNRLFTDPNWNLGKPLVTNQELDFHNEYGNYWGLQVAGTIFYADPGEPLE